MKVITPDDEEIVLGDTESTPTIGITDFSRRVTDDFGVTTVVPRAFARRMSVKIALPSTEVSTVQRQLAALRAVPAQWIADEDSAWLNFEGFYKDFSIDVTVGARSFCTLTVEGLAETETVEDEGEDPAPGGSGSTLQLLQPVTIAGAALVSTNVPETDWPAWAIGTTYALGARVIKTATHRIYESIVAGNIGNDPAGDSGKWIDIGPVNRWAMFDEALGTVTSRASSIVVTLDAGAATALALLDVTGATVRVQTTGYDETKAVGDGPVTFLDLPGVDADVTVTISGSGTVSVGTLLIGALVKLGITADEPTASINDFSKKEVDDFGEPTIVERAWAKRMSAKALIATSAIDLVANRIAAVRAKPSLYIADDGTDALTIWGFFKDFSIEVDQTVSTLSLSVEGLSEAMPIVEAFEGLSIIEKTFFLRSDTMPDTPTGGSFNFDTLEAIPPDDWSVSIPDGPGPAWAVIAVASKEGPGGVAPFGPYSAPVIAFANGADGDAGPPGTDGAPGSPGAPGTPALFTWYAYADAPDGSFNFSTGAPGGRSYQGIATGKTSATESTNPADYDWSPYIGPPNFGLVAYDSKTVIAANKLIKTSSSGSWDGSIHSTESFKGGASVSFVLDNTSAYFMAGLNSDPTSNADYSSLDFAIFYPAGTIRVYESGVEVHNTGAGASVGDVFTITYNGKTVVYSKNGAPFYTNNSPAPNLTLYFDSSIVSGPMQVGRLIAFVPAGQAGTDGTAGAPGAPGSNGVTYYTWYAYADAPDGTFNFTTGSPGNRQFQGIAYNKTTPTESTNPADYTWSDYVGPPNFGLAAFNSNSVVAGNKLIKVAGGYAWNASIHSTESFKGGASVSFVVDMVGECMVGLNTDPTTDASYISLDFAIYIYASDAVVYEGGSAIIGMGIAPVVGDVFTVTYNGRAAVYSKNGTPFYTNSSPPADLNLFLDSSIAPPAVQVGRILSFTAAGTAGADGDPGDPGISPVLATAAPASKQFSADADGTIKAGQLAFPVVISATKAGSTIGGDVTVLAVSGCTATATTDGFTIDTVSADAGYVEWEFEATDGQIVTGRMTFSRQRDPTGGGQVLVNFSSTTWFGSGSYASSGPTTTLSASATGKLKLTGFASFFSATNGTATITGKLQYRAVGSGTWIDAGISGTGVATRTIGVPGEPNDNTPGVINASGEVTGLTANGSYEMQMVGTRSGNSVSSATGYVAMQQVT